MNIPAPVAAAGAGLVYADKAAGTRVAFRQWLELPADQQGQMGLRGQRLFPERLDFAAVARHLLPLLHAALDRSFSWPVP